MIELVDSVGGVSWQGAVRTERRHGIPPGGPWDAFAAEVARALAGLGRDEPILELHRSCRVRLRTTGLARLATTGAPAALRIGGVGPVQAGRSQTIQAGTEVEITREGFGTTYVAFGPRTAPLPERLDLEPSGRGPIRFLPGPHAHLFPGWAAAGPYAVSWVGDRVGLRLPGAGPSHRVELVSEPSTPGAIQLTPGGDLIVLGPDGPTIGGYPVVGVVVSADFARLAHAGPEVEFLPCDQSHALEALRKVRQQTEQTLRAIALRS